MTRYLPTLAAYLYISISHGYSYLRTQSRISKDLLFIRTLINESSLDVLDLHSRMKLVFHLGGHRVGVGVELSYLTCLISYHILNTLHLIIRVTNYLPLMLLTTF